MSFFSCFNISGSRIMNGAPLCKWLTISLSFCLSSLLLWFYYNFTSISPLCNLYLIKFFFRFDLQKCSALEQSYLAIKSEAKVEILAKIFGAKKDLWVIGVLWTAFQVLTGVQSFWHYMWLKHRKFSFWGLNLFAA